MVTVAIIAQIFEIAQIFARGSGLIWYKPKEWVFFAYSDHCQTLWCLLIISLSLLFLVSCFGGSLEEQLPWVIFNYFSISFSTSLQKHFKIKISTFVHFEISFLISLNCLAEKME